MLYQASIRLKGEWQISHSLGKIETAVKNNGKPTKSEKETMLGFEKDMPEKCIEQYRSVNTAIQSAEEYKSI
jgi:hypothetical protein